MIICHPAQGRMGEEGVGVEERQVGRESVEKKGVGLVWGSVFV